MTIQTTQQPPVTAQPSQPPADWRQLDFAADGLVLRNAQPSNS